MKWFKLIKGIFGSFNRKGYSPEQPAMTQMVQIRCINPKCEACENYFDFDPYPYRAIRVAEKGEEGAESFIIECPKCGTYNKIYLILQKEKELTFCQKIGLRKRPPREDRGPNYINSPF